VTRKRDLGLFEELVKPNKAGENELIKPVEIIQSKSILTNLFEWASLKGTKEPPIV
jgi:hypothetical protein